MSDYLGDRQMGTVIMKEASKWKRVTSGVLQRSVFAPVMFMIHINDMVEGLNSYESLFADDPKLIFYYLTSKVEHILTPFPIAEISILEDFNVHHQLWLANKPSTLLFSMI